MIFRNLAIISLPVGRLTGLAYHTFSSSAACAPPTLAIGKRIIWLVANLFTMLRTKRGLSYHTLLRSQVMGIEKKVPISG